MSSPSSLNPQGRVKLAKRDSLRQRTLRGMSEFLYSSQVTTG